MKAINTNLVMGAGRARAAEAAWREQEHRARTPTPAVRRANAVLDVVLVVLGTIVLMACLNLAGQWYSQHIAESKQRVIDAHCERILRAVGPDGTVIDEVCVP